jgi:hypothetical protein
MISKTSKFLKTAFPFLAVILLWRLSVPFWNPGGVLAMIPIFYFSFIRPAGWFALFAAVFCFLIDYKSDTLLFWTAFYCLFYAANGLQGFVDLTRQKNDGILVFLGFFCTAAFLLALIGWSGAGFARAAFLVLMSGFLYVLFAILAKKVAGHD